MRSQSLIGGIWRSLTQHWTQGCSAWGVAKPSSLRLCRGLGGIFRTRVPLSSLVSSTGGFPLISSVLWGTYSRCPPRQHPVGSPGQLPDWYLNVTTGEAHTSPVPWNGILVTDNCVPRVKSPFSRRSPSAFPSPECLLSIKPRLRHDSHWQGYFLPFPPFPPPLPSLHHCISKSKPVHMIECCDNSLGVNILN